VSVESEVTLRVANSAKRLLNLSVYDGLPGMLIASSFLGEGRSKVEAMSM
jgi:hypothetical protein